MARFQAIAKQLGEAATKGTPLVVGAGVLGGGLWAVNQAMYTVEAGHKAIKYNRLSGVGDQAYNEGLNFMIPWFERPIIFDIRAKPYEIVSLSGTKDLQMVNISLRTLRRPNPGKLSDLYRSLGFDYEDKVLKSIGHEVLKSVVAQYNASSLITQRELVSRMIRQRLTERAHDFNLLLDDVAITHISFSEQYEKAVESKQVAQQQAERARYLVLQAQEEKKKTIIHAEGETKSAAMIGDAIAANPGFIELRRISVAKDVANLLAKSNNRMVLSTESLLLNLMKPNTVNADALENTSAPPAGKKK